MKLNLVLLLMISKLVKIKSFIAITIITLTGISVCKKKRKKFIILLYLVYFLEIFVIFFPINKYGADIFTVNFLKRKLTPDSFIKFKSDLASKKTLKEKISLSYGLAKDIKYRIKELELVEKELEKTKEIEKKFILLTDILDIL